MKLLVFTNILTPYRIAFFDELYNNCFFSVCSFRVLVMSETEENRNWYYHEFQREYTKLLKGCRISVGGYKLNINKGIQKEIGDFKPDVVIAAGSYIEPSLWVLIYHCKRHRIPILFWSESHLNTERHYSSTKIRLRETVRHLIYKRFNGFCFSGSLSKQFIEKYAKPDTSYIYLPNLIDDKFYGSSAKNERLYSRIQSSLNIKEGTRVYIIPARLSPDKGILDFLETFRFVQTTHHTKILIAGDGPLYEDIQNYSEENQLDIVLMGFLSKDTMRCLYQLADGFILPSKVDPNPLTCIEALWSKLPLLVSSHVGNYPEVIDEGRNGYVFTYHLDEIKVIADFLNQSDTWYKNAALRSRAKAEENYSLSAVAKRFLAELAAIIENQQEYEFAT